MLGFFPSSRIQQEKPVANLVPKCGACGLYKKCASPKMEPFGQGSKRVLVVGEAPGETEDEEGRPFIGKAGQHLRTSLGQIGVSMDKEALTTNALICHPPKNATPDLKQIGYCRPNLLATIRDFEPVVVLTLGRSALVSVIQDYWKGDVGVLDRWVGWKIPAAGFWVCPTYHPSYLMRMKNPLLDRLFVDHLEQAFGTTRRPPEAEDYGRQIKVLYDDDEIVSELRSFHSEGGWVAVDYETNCLKPDYEEALIHSFAISNGTRTVSFPWMGKGPIEAVGRILRSRRLRKVASNLKFEERWTQREFGHGVERWGWDTMLAAHCLDNRPHICSLKFQALVKIGVPTYNEHIEPFLYGRGRYNRISQIETQSLLYYGAMDALLEYRLAMIQRKEMGYDTD